MQASNLGPYLWVALAVLVIGSLYLIAEGYRVHKLFADSVVGRLIKALVVVFLIELYSLGIASFVLFYFYPKGLVVLLPIFILWIISLGFAIYAVRSAKNQVTGLMK